MSKTIVKYIQSLSYKKFRDEYGLFIAEGSKVVTEFLTSGIFKCKIICAAESWMDEHKDVTGHAEDIFGVTEYELEKISLLKTPNKVVAVFYQRTENKADLKDHISLMLDEIQDPGNMGTIIRTADWFGIKNIICSPGCADSYNPKVVQATMGSLARINIIYTDLEIFIRENESITLYATALDGKNVLGMKKIREGIILIGNESKGIKEDLLKLASEKITIPGSGGAESLNAGVAAGIILSHLSG